MSLTARACSFSIYSANATGAVTEHGQLATPRTCLQELKVAALQQDLDAQRAALGRCSKSPNLTPDMLQVACSVYLGRVLQSSC